MRTISLSWQEGQFMGVSNSSAVLDVVMEMHRKRGSVWQSKTLQEVAELVLDGRLSNAAGG